MSTIDLLQTARIFAQARRRARSLDADRLAAFQQRRAQSMVRWVAAHAPFYREHWRGSDLRDWRALPPVDKALMMANFDRFNTRGVTRDAAMAVALRAEQDRDFTPQIDGLTVGLSSGTSGHRGLFLVSADEQRLWAATILARALHRIAPTRIAFFLRANSNLYEQLGGRLIRFRYFDIMTPLDHAIDALNRFRPTVIVGPPSLLMLLAQARMGRSLHASPERLISVAEVLEPQDRSTLEMAFGAPVEQIYQATEGLLAIGCARGRLHIQEDVVVIEGQPLGDGRITPIVTDLWRRTQPIIRYRLNDVLTISDEHCACGSAFRVIERIEGRCDDLCYFSTTRGRRAIFPDAIRRALLLSDPAIREYRAIQRADDLLDVTLELDAIDPEPICRAAAESLRSMLASYGCDRPRISIGVGVAPRPAGAKLRRVTRAVTPCAS